MTFQVLDLLLIMAEYFLTLGILKVIVLHFLQTGNFSLRLCEFQRIFALLSLALSIQLRVSLAPSLLRLVNVET